GLWRARYDADPEVLGEVITLSGAPYTIIGVAAPDFAFPGRAQIWVPLGFGVAQSTERSSHSYDVVGRLQPGVALEQAQADLAGVARDLEREYPESNAGRGVVLIPLASDTLGAVRPTLLLLSGAVAFVLLIACANVANLFLARAATRQRELAIRSALGGKRWRLARQVLAESVLLAVGGGVLGLLLASWLVDLLLVLRPPGIPRLQEVSVDGTVLLFTLVVSVTVGLLFGLVPALAMAGQDPADAFRAEGRGSSQGPRRALFRNALVVAQVSLALVLLAGAALLVVTVRRLGAIDPGFDPAGAVSFRLSIPAAKYPDEPRYQGYVARLLEQLEAIPGVGAASAVFHLPLGDGDVNGDFSIAGREPAAPGQEALAGYRLVGGDYFAAMGVRLRGGRFFQRGDGAGSQPVAILSEALARKYFAGENPLGKRIAFWEGSEGARWYEIVGMVADVKHLGLTVTPGPELYVPLSQLQPDLWSIFAPISLSFIVRGNGGAEALTPAIRAAVRAVDPEQPIARLRETGELIADAVANQRFGMMLLTLFGALALTLATVGVYGVMAYTVSQRTRELGIRLALGAGAASVGSLVLRQGLGITLVGIAIGLLGALGLSRLLGGLLYGVNTTDPLVLGAVTLLLIVASVAACAVPAARATRVDPIEALRSE
ncbi:MAG: ABC transporter permease, partial [Gemmatimonadales bacterium]